MQDSAHLRRIVGDLLQVEPATIDSEFSLRHPRLQTSAGRGVLAAAIHREFGVYSAKVFTAVRFGDLEAAVLGTSTAPPPAGSTSQPSSTGEPSVVQALPSGVSGIGIGVDVELVENMPDVQDFWTEPFYQSHFTPAEIAYCVRQEQPRMHFAARWCAKEALAKCEPRFAGRPPASIQVRSGESRQPFFEVSENGTGWQPISVALSLSHTPQMAVAVVASVSPRERA